MNPQQLNRREKKRNAFTATIKQDSLRNMDPDFKQWVKKKTSLLPETKLHKNRNLFASMAAGLIMSYQFSATMILKLYK